MSCQFARQTQQYSKWHWGPAVESGLRLGTGTYAEHFLLPYSEFCEERRKWGGKKELTRHVEAQFSLLNIYAAPRTRLGVSTDELFVLRVLFPVLALVLLAGESPVPGHLMAKAHIEAALLAADLRVLGHVVEAAVFACVPQTPPEVELGTYEIQKAVVVEPGRAS